MDCGILLDRILADIQADILFSRETIYFLTGNVIIRLSMIPVRKEVSACQLYYRKTIIP